jgi:hypothetical protein
MKVLRSGISRGYDTVNYNTGSKWVNPYTYKMMKDPDSVKGKNLVNKNTGEKIRINKDTKNDYDSSVWISPQAYAKLIKGK